MLAHVLRRLAGLVPLLLAVSLVTFGLIELAPGRYVDILIENPRINRAVIDRLIEHYALDRPFHERYLRWLGLAVRGDLGYSFAYGQPVFGLIAERVGNTLVLGAAAMALAWGIALPLGVL